MNNKTSIYLFLGTALFFFGCRGPVKRESKNNVSASSVSVGEEYNIDTKESVVTWKGSMLIGSNSHTGYVYISKGNLMIEEDQIVGGTTEVDMSTIEDENHESDNNLINHLKDPDFFDVKIFPVATFKFTKPASMNTENKFFTGDLTIKGITRQVVFPAEIEVKDGIVKLNGTLVIDRTLWNVRYKSRKFYDLLADQTMSDSIEFKIKVVAKKTNP